MSSLTPWNPEAGFFHTATRDVAFSSRRRARRFAREKAESSVMPPPVKQYRHAVKIDLPRINWEGEFPAVLRARRTWRRYSIKGLRLGELSQLLGMTVGVQQWVHVDSRRMALKTSPSGGARHPIECYVVNRTVQGLTPGIYHYAADRHALERIRGEVPLERMQAYLPSSGYFANASVMVFFTAVFARILWRYEYLPRVPRSARGSGPPLPDLLPDRHMAGLGALLCHGPGGLARRAGPRHRRHHRGSAVLRRRWPSSPELSPRPPGPRPPRH